MPANLLLKKRFKPLVPYLLILPAIFMMFWIVVYPIYNAVKMSFYEYYIYKPDEMKFVGMRNYAELLQEETFRNCIPNTVYWVLFCLIFQALLGLAFALVLNCDFKGRGLCRTINMIPWVTPTVLITLMWRWMYDGNYGVLNDLMQKAGMIDTFIPWLSLPNTALTAVCVIKTWQGIPFFAVMILASLQGIPKDVYEAAHVDGAGSLKVFTKITMPYIMPQFLITALLRTIWISNDVDMIYMTTMGGPVDKSLTLSVYAYQTAQTLNFGKASAISLLFTLVLMVLVLIYLFQIRKSERKFA